MIMGLIIINILFFIFCGFSTACISYFLQYTYREGAIFSFWLPFVARTIVRLTDRTVYLSVRNNNDMPKFEKNERYQHIANNHWLYNILGGCGICSNVWVGIAFYLLFMLQFVNFWYIFIFLPINSFLYRKIEEFEE